MIREDEVFKIGKLLKPHGVKGEIAFAFENDVFDRVDCNYLILLIDGIFVPFFIKEYRFKGKEIALILFEDLYSEEDVINLSGLNVYFPRKYFEEDLDVEYSWNYFIGFVIEDENLGHIGTIDAVDELTINTLFLVKGLEQQEFIIPATESFIKNVDDKNKVLTVSLPEGLILIN